MRRRSARRTSARRGENRLSSCRLVWLTTGRVLAAMRRDMIVHGGEESEKGKTGFGEGDRPQSFQGRLRVRRQLGRIGQLGGRLPEIFRIGRMQFFVVVDHVGGHSNSPMASFDRLRYSRN